ncbi:hypothetical protein FRC06_001607 [Ceratobasidium sp. 370]|nr:hypothetical protein FRC06_001607 [Ceratobasidium sp. 370]
MSLKLELETWAAALKAYDEEDFDKSLETFGRIAESSKILTNIGLIYATLGEHEAAVQHFREAVSLDKYLAVAYFQCGVSNFLLGRYDEAFGDFDEALVYLRGNQAINYEQLGLKFRLYSAEVLFNKGLCQIYMNRLDNGLQDIREAQKAKVTEEHNVIDDAIQDQGEGYTVFSIPVGILYRPSESKLKNAKTKDFLGKAQLIAASDAKDAFTTFTGVTRLQQGLTPSGAPIIDGRPIPPLSRAVTAAARLSSAPPTDEPKPVLQKSATIGPSDPTRKPGLSRNPSTGAGLTRNPTTLSTRDPATLPTRNPTLGANNPKSPAGDLSRNTSASGSSGGAPAPGPVRGLSVRRPSQAQGQQGPPRLPRIEPLMTPERSRSPQEMISPGSGGRDRMQSPGNQDDPRLTEFYDDYIGAYEEPAPPPPPPVSEGVAAWAARIKGAPPPPSGPPSRSGSVAGGRGYDARERERGYDSRSGYEERSRPPPSSYGGSSVSVRRKLSRRPTRNAYEEEEEGYVSGEYSDAPFELVKIRVKLHYKDDVRGMAISPEMRFEEFLEKVSAKFGRPFGALGLRFKDEDGGRVSMRDDSDYDLAIETARESAKGRPEGKLEIWCTDE